MIKTLLFNKSKKPSIVFLISSLGGGGAEKIMASLVNNYSSRGVQVTLITLDDPKMMPDVYQLNNKVKRITLPLEFSDNIFSKLCAHGKRYFRLRNFLYSEKPDVLLSFMTPNNILAIMATRALHIRCVVSERVNPLHYSYGRVINTARYFFYRKASCVVAQTPQISQWLKKKTASSVLTIPNFLDKDKSHLRVQKTNIILAVGRLNRQKGFDLLILAFAKLSQDFLGWTILIVGEGPEREALNKLIHNLNLHTRVQLCGFIDRPFITFQYASIVVQPSRFEGFPNSVLEAMAYGYSTIATYEAGGMLIEGEVNGLLIPANDVDALAKALKRMMESPQLREKLGEEALKVSETFSEERIMRLWDKVLFPSLSIMELPNE